LRVREERRYDEDVNVTAHSFAALLACAALGLTALPACNGSDGYTEPGPRPQIVSMNGPADAVLACDPATVGGACPLPIHVKFRLPEDHFVWKAYVRFQNDGSEDGVDRVYLVAPTYGRNDADVDVTIAAYVPPTILRKGATFTYGVRLVTGIGEESPMSTLTVSVQ
jgi:hypothetical protein